MSEQIDSGSYIRGMKCPKCRSRGPFRIECLVFATFTPREAKEESDHRFTDESECVCSRCDFLGTVGRFLGKKPSKKDGKLVSCPQTFDDLMPHCGHEVSVVYYGKSKEDAMNVAIECETCGVVILDIDR